MASVLQADGYRRLFISAAGVVFTVMGQAVARGWLARDLTGTNAGLGGVMLVFGFAMLVATPWGGVAADRLPKRFLLLASVGALTVSSLLLGVAVAADTIAYWMLLVASGVQAAAFAFYLPARIAFITELVAAEQIPEAITLSQTAQEAMRVIAPALAGVLIGVSWSGTAGVFLLAAATNVLAGVVLLGLPPGRPSRHSDRSPLAEMSDAVAYVRRTHGLGLIALTTIGVVIVGWPYLTFLPALADERYGVGAGGYGVMSGIAGLGAVGAGLVAPHSRWMARRPWTVIALSGMAFGASVVALGLAHTFWLALVVLVLVGATALVFQTTTMSLMLSLSDVEFHGRLQSMGRARLQRLRARGVAVRRAGRRLVAARGAGGDGPGGGRDQRRVRVAALDAQPPSGGPARAGVDPGSRHRLQGDQSTPGRVATQCSAMRSSSMRCTIIHVTTARSPVSRLMPTLVARVIAVAGDDPVVDPRRRPAERPLELGDAGLVVDASNVSVPVIVCRVKGSASNVSSASRSLSRQTSPHHRSLTASRRSSDTLRV